MRKLIFTCLALLLASPALSGCKVEGEIDPDGKVTYNSVMAL
jgi:hypothetical protein